MRIVLEDETTSGTELQIVIQPGFVDEDLPDLPFELTVGDCYVGAFSVEALNLLRDMINNALEMEPTIYG